MRDRLEAELSGRYAIERELGRGGMATVWLAHDVRHDREVAIKLLHGELAGAVAAERFVREVRVTARLQHPSIVPVLDSGILKADDGTVLPWYAMPFISGESLRVRIQRETQLAVDESIRITREVAGALGEAHRHGVVHRDIKPENIMLDGERVYVVDFGIAKALLDTGDERLTSTGLSIGTAIYMSPEQASGGSVDGRSDEYSLATVLYEMLTGEAPFAGANAQAVVARRFAEAARPMRHVRSTISPALEQVVLKALERTPADRYADITTFAKQLDLNRVTGSTASYGRLHSRLTVAIAVGLVAIVAGLWAVLGRPMHAKKLDPALLTLYQNGVRGYEKRTPEGVDESIRDFKGAIAKDSTFALAWVGLAKSYARAYERAFVFPVDDSIVRLGVLAADRGLALDSTIAEAWTARAAVFRLVDPTNVAPSIRAARRALALDSANAGGWHFLAMGLVESGQMDSALEKWRECIRRVPRSTMCLGFMAQGMYWHKQFGDGIRWADSAVAIDASYVLGLQLAGLNAIELGQFPRAVSALEATRRVTTRVEVPIMLASRAMAEARSGDRSAARATLRIADSLARPYSPPPTHLAVWMAEAHVEAGDVSGGLQWLRQFPNRADLHYQVHLRCDPPFGKLAGNPEFKAMLLPPITGC